MTLESFFDTELTSSQIKSKIRQRRAQLLVHSYIYYVLDDNIVSDDKWQEWANQLRVIQEQYPQYCKIDFFDKYFYTWTGDTGMHLPLKDPYVIHKALELYNYEKGEK